MAFLACIFSAIGFLASIAYLGIFVTFHFLPGGYHPISQAMSDYGVGKYSRLFRIYIQVSALAAFALGCALAFANFGIPGWIPTILIVLGLARIGLARFETDLEGQSLTRNGRLHYFFAVITFALVYIAISNLTTLLSPIAPWASAAGALAILKTAAAGSLGALVVTLIPPLRRIFGLFERLFLISENVWFVIVTALLVAKVF